jgi:hypothetical protein
VYCPTVIFGLDVGDGIGSEADENNVGMAVAV